MLFIAESPTDRKDKESDLFNGKAGKLFDKILLAIGISREEDISICSLNLNSLNRQIDSVNYRMNACIHNFKCQIDLIKPKLIVALGRVAGNMLLDSEMPLKDMRLKSYSFNSFPLVITYHPADLLLNSDLKPNAWTDFKNIKSIIKN